MLSVLADVGGLMAEGIEYTWLVNKDRLRALAEKINIVKPKSEKDELKAWVYQYTIRWPWDKKLFLLLIFFILRYE